MMGFYYRLGKDYGVSGVAKYIDTLPSDLPPAVAGTLIDERTDIKEILATIFDLAKRGYIEITEKVEKVWVFTNRDYELKLKKSGYDLLSYEKKVMDSLFSVSTPEAKIKISDLKNKFYLQLTDIKEKIYKETIKRGYFEEDPRKVIAKYIITGILVLVVGVVLLFFGDVGQALFSLFM